MSGSVGREKHTRQSRVCFSRSFAYRENYALGFLRFPSRTLEAFTHSENPIESTFATVRYRTKRSKNYLSRKTALPMVFKLIMAAQKRWRAIDAKHLLLKLESGVIVTDGLETEISSAA